MGEDIQTLLAEKPEGWGESCTVEESDDAVVRITCRGNVLAIEAREIVITYESEGEAEEKLRIPLPQYDSTYFLMSRDSKDRRLSRFSLRLVYNDPETGGLAFWLFANAKIVRKDEAEFLAQLVRKLVRVRWRENFPEVYEKKCTPFVARLRAGREEINTDRNLSNPSGRISAKIEDGTLRVAKKHRVNFSVPKHLGCVGVLLIPVLAGIGVICIQLSENEFPHIGLPIALLGTVFFLLKALSREEMCVDSSGLQYRTWPMPAGWYTRLDADEIADVYIGKHKHPTDYDAVIITCIEDRQEDDDFIRFGIGLNREELEWVRDVVRLALAGHAG